MSSSNHRKIRTWRTVLWLSIIGLLATLASMFLVYQSRLSEIAEQQTPHDDLEIYLQQRNLILEFATWPILICLVCIITISAARYRLKQLKKN